MAEASVERLARAIVTRAASLFEVEADFDASMLDQKVLLADSLTVGGHTLDSVDFVELMVTLETDLGYSILDLEDIESLATLRGLALLLLDEADDRKVEAFCQRWAVGAESLSGL